MAGTTTVGPWIKAGERKSKLWYCDIVFAADGSDGSFIPGETEEFTGMLTGFEVAPGGTAPDAGMDMEVTNARGAELVSADGQGADVGGGGYFPTVVVNNGSGSAAYETGLVPFSGSLTVTPSGNATNSAVFTFRLWALRV